MAENDVDSGQATGTAGTPNSQGSAGDGGSGSSIDAAKLQSLIEGFGKRIEEIDARTKALQGDKDRAVVKTRKEVDELKAKIAEYEKLKSKGLDPDEALDEIDFRSTVRQLQEQIGSLGKVQASPAGNGQGMTADTAQVLQKAGLDANDAQVIELIKQHGNDAVSFALGVGELKARMAAKPQPSAAASPTIQSGSAASHETDVSSLSQEYSRLVKEPGKNFKRLKEIEDLLNKA